LAGSPASKLRAKAGDEPGPCAPVGLQLSGWRHRAACGQIGAPVSG